MNLSPVYHNSRPDGELLPQEAAAFDLLDRLGIEYDRVSHDAAFNMELCAEVGRALGVSVLFVEHIAVVGIDENGGIAVDRRVKSSLVGIADERLADRLRHSRIAFLRCEKRCAHPKDECHAKSDRHQECEDPSPAQTALRFAPLRRTFARCRTRASRARALR